MNRLFSDKLASLFIIALIIIIYGKVSGFDFILFDDPEYVFSNSNVNQGLSWDALIWALTTGHVGNWHPLTWLSLMLDVELFGINPGAHHLVNLLFHTVNSLLLFILARKMGADAWGACVVALLFALHPAHVESVAWISERKDVLSTLFFLLGIILYIEYVRMRLLRTYLIMCLVYLFGLISKPMVITFPFVLLLFDYWPLRRLENSPYKQLIIEKLPLFIMSLASAFVTMKMQSVAGAMSLGETLSLSERLSNAIVSVVRYGYKVFDVSDLTIFYPHPGSWPVLHVSLSAFVILIFSFLVLRFRKSKPYLLFGGLWFIGTLVPVIGVVQVGTQSIADRYTYIPYIGLFIAIVWLAGEQEKTNRRARNIFFSVIVAMLGLYAVSTFRYLDIWEDDGKLFENLITVHEKNYYGYWAKEENRTFLQKANAKLATFYNNDGLKYLRNGNHETAIKLFLMAIEKNPDDFRPYYNLSLLSIEKGNYEDAELFMGRVLEIEPTLFEKLKPYLDVIKRQK